MRRGPRHSVGPFRRRSRTTPGTWWVFITEIGSRRPRVSTRPTRSPRSRTEPSSALAQTRRDHDLPHERVERRPRPGHPAETTSIRHSSRNVRGPTAVRDAGPLVVPRCVDMDEPSRRARSCQRLVLGGVENGSPSFAPATAATTSAASRPVMKIAPASSASDRNGVARAAAGKPRSENSSKVYPSRRVRRPPWSCRRRVRESTLLPVRSDQQMAPGVETQGVRPSEASIW